MQLGELQSQIDRFRARGTRVIAISVDPPAHSTAMIGRIGINYIVASDSDQSVQKAYGVQNPETQELALHAVYLVNEEQRVFYRKIAGKRPKSQELLDAIDYEQGNYPVNDTASNYQGTPVAFPRNNFQALIEVATSSPLPESVDEWVLQDVIELIHSSRLDDATIAYRRYVDELAGNHSEAALLDVAAWIAKEAAALPEDALLTGAALNQALMEQRRLRSADAETSQLDAAQAHLDRLRSLVSTNANNWRLGSLKTTLRSYRELSLAATRTQP